MKALSFSKYYINVTCIDIAGQRDYVFSFLKNDREISHFELTFSSTEQLASSFSKYIETSDLTPFSQCPCSINVISDRYIVQSIFFPGFNPLKNKKIIDNAFTDTFDKNYALVSKTDTRRFKINRKYGAAIGLIKKDLIDNIEVEMKTLGLKITKISTSYDLMYRAVSKVKKKTGAIIIATAKYFILGFIVDRTLINMNVLSTVDSPLIPVFLTGYLNDASQKFNIRSLDQIDIFSEYTDNLLFFSDDDVQVTRWKINHNFSNVRCLKAFTLIETVVALTIFSISLAGLLTGLIVTDKLAKKNNERAKLINAMENVLTVISNRDNIIDGTYYLSYAEADISSSDSHDATYTVISQNDSYRFTDIRSLNFTDVTMEDFNITL